MVKHVYIIFLVSMSSLCLNAMTPDVTNWKEICEQPEEKRKLEVVYKDFCKKRVKNSILWAVGSCAPLVSKTVRDSFFKGEAKMLVVGIAALFAMRQTYLLGRNIHRSSLAIQKDLSYLNQDVLEQLGNPKICPHFGPPRSFEVQTYKKKGESQKNVFGNAMGTFHTTFLGIEDIDDIKKALSGDYLACSDPDFPKDETLKVAAFKIKQNIKAIIRS